MKAPPGASAWPVRVASLGPVALGSTLWRSAGQLYVTAIAKATFNFTIDDVARCTAPLPIRRLDECAKGVPSLAGASETAPRVPLVDVVLVGHAYAPPGTTKSTIRLVVMADRPLIDKSLLVYGKRKPGTKPQPFHRMRIGYERALGGLTFPDNPIGTGADEDSEQLPNVVHPADPEGMVGGFGPIPSRFTSRRQRRGKVDPEHILNGIADYPDDFDWSYFQCAPVDQRLPALAGNEWIMLEGLHPDHGLVRTRLPSARAVASVYSRRPGVVPTTAELTLDTVHIEPNDNRLSLLWRGAFPVMSELAAGELVIAGGLELSGKTIQWPQSIDELETLASPEVDATELAGGRDDELQRTGEPVAPGATPAAPFATPSSPHAAAPAQSSGLYGAAPAVTPSAAGVPAAPPSAQGFPEAPPSAQGFPEAPPSAQGFPEAPPSAQGFPEAPPSAQGFPEAPPSAPGHAIPAPAPSAPYHAPAAAPSAPYAVPAAAPSTPYAATPAPSAPYQVPAAAPSVPYAVPTPPIAPGAPAAPQRRQPPPPRRASAPAIEIPHVVDTDGLDVTHQIVDVTHEAEVEEVEPPAGEKVSWETTDEMDEADLEAADRADHAAAERKS